MKRYCVLFFALSVFVLPANETPAPYISPITIHFETSNQNQAGATSQANPAITVSNQNTLIATLQTYTTLFFEKLPTWSQNGYSFLAHNKFKIGLGIIALSYAGIWYKLYQLERYITNKESWASWKSHLNLNELLSTNQRELSRDLLHAIQKRYASPHNLYDFVLPLVHFMQEFNDEMAKLKQLVAFHEWIYFCRISRLFFIKKTSLEQAKERITRLHFLHNVLTTWMSDYKLETTLPFKN